MQFLYGFIMLSAIDLYRKFYFWTIKIEDVFPHAKLSIKFQAFDFSISNKAPHLPFGVCGVFS